MEEEVELSEENEDQREKKDGMSNGLRTRRR